MLLVIIVVTYLIRTADFKGDIYMFHLFDWFFFVHIFNQLTVKTSALFVLVGKLGRQPCI